MRVEFENDAERLSVSRQRLPARMGELGVSPVMIDGITRWRAGDIAAGLDRLQGREGAR